MIIKKFKKNKKVFLIITIIILLFLITILLIKVNQKVKQQKFIEQETKRVRQYSSITDFKSLEEVALYLKCNLIKQELSENDNIEYNIYMQLPININNSEINEKNFVENLIQFSAYVLKYKNFIIIDEKNNTTILVYCNEEQQLIEKYYINNIENYFDVMENKKNIENFEKIDITKLNVTSEILNEIIANNWQLKNVNFGTSESVYRNYNIFFDEGLQVRQVDGKVFNIIFTEKYQNYVVNNLKTNSNLEEVKKTLGKPQFEEGKLIGYKSEDIYVFFYENQISVYRIEKYDTEEIAKIIQNKKSDNKNEKVFVDEIKNVWKDYDIYEFNEDYVKLQYTLKGLCIKYDSTTKKGVILYNNYKGKVYGDTALDDVINNKIELPNYINIENKDLVYEEELKRVNTLDDTTFNNNYSNKAILNTSNKFKVHRTYVDKDKTICKVRFISINNEFPNSELRELMCTGIWYDDYNFIYSVKNRGIYLYDVQNRIYKTLVTGKDDFKIYAINEGCLYYDDGKQLLINI